MTGRVAAMILAASLAASCSSSGDEQILVSGAASLTNAFAEIAAEFEATSDFDVVLNFAGSSALREQLLAGAPADVFASANSRNMDEIEAAGLLRGDAVGFAVNRLEIAVPTDNPAGIARLDQLADESVLVGLCAVGVPCGDLARLSLDQAGIDIGAASEEPNVRSLLAKVEAGELDAGIVYATDIGAGEVAGVAIPAKYNSEVVYPIAVLDAGPNPDGADAFVSFVLSSRGREILLAHGFGLP